jgi:hypothetical protein
LRSNAGDPPAGPPAAGRRSDAKIAALLAIAIALLFSDVLFLGSGFYVRDIVRDYLPSRFVLRAVVGGGEFPLWNRFYSGGQPLAANPGFQTFYPGTWLCFLPSFLLGFNLEIVLHIALAAVGMFLLLRSMELRTMSALFGAVTFGLGGIVLSLTNLLPFLTSVAWWPLIVMFARRGRWAPLALSLGMLLLAAEQSVIVQTAILLIAVSRHWGKMALALLLAIGIAAVQLVPTLDLKRDSERARDLTYEEATAWSMPAIRPLELFYAHAFGRITDDGRAYRGAWRYQPPRLPLIFSIYCGLLVPLLALAGIRLPLARWTWPLALLSYLIAIGANGPLIPALYRIGIYRSIRYPEKFVLFGVFALIILAAATFDRLDRRLAPFLLVFTIGDVALHITELAPRMPRRFFTPPPVTLALADARHAARIFHQAEWPVWGAHAIPIEAGSRTYWSQRTALLPFTTALFGLQTIYEIDINLTALRPASELLQSMWEALGQQASLRPFMLMGNAEYLILPGKPIRIVRGQTLPRYWFADQLAQIDRREDFVRAMTSARWSDRVAFVRFAPFQPGRGEVVSVRESANGADLQVRAGGRAFLVASVTPHRYWRATVDGAPVTLQIANVGFQGLIVPQGTHTIAFRYRNPLFVLFGFVSLVSLISAIAICFRIERRPLAGRSAAGPAAGGPAGEAAGVPPS